MTCLIIVGAYILGAIAFLLAVGAAAEAFQDSQWWRARRWR